MANQAIALQARAPQNDFMGRAIQQNAQMINMMSQQRAAERQAAVAQQEMELARVEEARRAELHGPAMDKARSEATAAGIKTALDFSNFVYTGLSNAADPAQAMQIAQRIGQQPQFQENLFQGALADAMSTMPQDPAQFEVWKENTLSKTLDGAKRLERQLIEQNLGTSTRVISAPKYGSGGAARVLEGSEAAVTMKPTVVNVEGIGPIIVDPNTGQGFPAAAGPTGGYKPPRGPMSEPRGAPGAGGDTFSRMIGVESRGQQFDRSGKPLTSPAGAIGIAQVMPGTAPEAARLAGLPFDENRYRNDRDYNLALGKAYYEKQLADFGDERLAAAAYNAGPGAVRRALQKGGPDGWINHVPRETQNYIRDVFGAAPAARGSAGGAGAPPPRTVAQAASAAEKERKVKTFQELSGVNLNTQLNTDTDPVSELIKGSTSGAVEAIGAELMGALPESIGGGATPGMKNIGRLETIATTLTLAFAPEGRLSTGVSNEDRRVIERQLGVIQDPTIPSGKRLAAWGEVKRIMARTIGLTEAAAANKPAAAKGGGASIPTLTPEQVRANPKIKRWRTTDGRIMTRP